MYGKSFFSGFSLQSLRVTNVDIWVSEDFMVIMQSCTPPLKGGGCNVNNNKSNRLWRCFGVQGDYNHSDNEWKFTEEYTVAHHSHPVFYSHRAPAWHKSGSLGIWRGSRELCLQPLLVWKYSFLFPLHFQNPRIIVITVETLENLLYYTLLYVFDISLGISCWDAMQQYFAKL